MTRQQFLEEIKQLSITERIALIEAISRSLREEIEARGESMMHSERAGSETNPGDEHKSRIAAVRRLQGILKTSGNPPSDEELKDDYTNYLIEKYF